MNKSFLQSNGWEQFQRSVGHQTLRMDGILIIEKKLLFRKKYWYIPYPDFRFHLPVGEAGISDFRLFLQTITQQAKKDNITFIRIEPLEPLPYNLLYPVKKVNDVQPAQTIILDLTQSAEKILAQMHPKTRYNIRLSQKKGVAIREADSSDFDAFWELMEKTTERDNFRPHDREYYRKMLQPHPNPPLPKPFGGVKIRGGNERERCKIKLFFAEFEGDVLAAGIFAFCDETVTYVHGASSSENRDVMAPYALHWQIIQMAKVESYKFYDLFGISETKWPGVTRFKKGFGGKEVNYPGCFDIVFNKSWYAKYTLMRKLRRYF
ncbi:MAG: peptidoglycan bridge formation glycyltransferase FemA/FemB family protein [bacterium]|nr:peptidoglycan bridge formation glycyltransferase FemA/FemB family protein [bacterium]